MGNVQSPQQGQFKTLGELLRTLLYTRLTMHKRGIEPRLARVLTPEDTREEIWAEAVTAEILGIFLLGRPPGPDGKPAGITLAQAGAFLQVAAAETNSLRERFLELDPTLADIPAGHGALLQLLDEYLKRQAGKDSCTSTP